MDSNTDYKIQELFEQAKADESWEADPAIRERAANGLYFTVISM